MLQSKQERKNISHILPICREFEQFFQVQINEVWQNVSQRVYANQGQQAQQTGEQAQEQTQEQANVQDAEFEEVK